MARKVQAREVGRAGAGWGREGRTSCMMRVSSSSVHPSLHTDGQSWLCHRSRACLPRRDPGSCAAISVQRRGPSSATSCVSREAWGDKGALGRGRV